MNRAFAASILAVPALFGGALAQTTYELAISGAKSEGFAAASQDLTISGTIIQYSAYATGVIDGAVYMIGGFDGNNFVTSVTKLEISSDAVAATDLTLTGSLPTFSYPKSVSTNEKIYV